MLGSGIVMTLQRRRDLVDPTSSQSTHPLTSIDGDGGGSDVVDGSISNGDDVDCCVDGSGVNGNASASVSTGCDDDGISSSIGPPARVIITEEGKTIAVPDDYRNNSLRGSIKSNPQSNLQSNRQSKHSPADLTPSQISQSSNLQSSNPQSNNYPIGTKKHIWLPPRSLLLLSGEARYLWYVTPLLSHFIPCLSHICWE